MLPDSIMFRLYALPQWLFCLVVILVFVGVALAGQAATRKRVRRWLGDRDCNDVVGQYLSAIGLLYGITLGLISVGAWENYGEVEGKVSQEAAAVATLYRSVDTYPEPSRAILIAILREYTRHVIDVAWPEMRRGILPAGGNPIITRFLHDLLTAMLALLLGLLIFLLAALDHPFQGHHSLDPDSFELVHQQLMAPPP